MAGQETSTGIRVKKSNAAAAEVGAEQVKTTPEEMLDNKTEKQSEPTIIPEAFNSGIYSIFGSDSYGLSAKMVKHINDLFTAKNANGKAAVVTIGGSNFTGVNIQLVIANKTYSQAIIIDERPLKNVKQMLDDDKMAGGQTIVFGSALLFDKNKKFLSPFDTLNKKTIQLDSLVIVAETVKDHMLDSVVKNILQRMEAKPFTSLKEVLDKDKSLDLNANFNTDGQKVTIIVNQKDKQQSFASAIFGSAGPILGVTGRVDTVLCKKQIFKNGVPDQVFALRPIMYIDKYDRPGTIASHNLEYGLMAIASASIALDMDKYISALLPTAKHRNNIGALNTNSLFPIVTDANGVAKPIDLLSPKADINDKIAFIRDITADPSLGIDIEYKVTPSPLAVFATIADANASADEKARAGAELNAAYENFTGTPLKGKIIESVIQYPTGTIVDGKGNEVELKDIDAIWLAGLGIDEAENLAQEWIISNTSSTGYSTKLEILSKLMMASGLEIKVRGVGYKIILATEFLSGLLTEANFIITSPVILEIPDVNAKSFDRIGANIGLATHIGGIGRAPSSFNGYSGVKIIGL